MFVLRLFLVFSCMVSVAYSAELQLLNNTKIQGQVVSIDPKGVTFKGPNGEKVYLNNELIAVDFGLANKENTTGKWIDVELIDGSVFHCSEFKVKGTTAILTLYSPESKGRTIELPTSSIFTMLRDAQETLNALDFRNLIGRLRQQRRDIYVFAKGEGANRKLTGLTGTFGEGTVDPEQGDKLSFTTESGAEQKLFQNRIHGLMFSQAPNENPPPTICRVVDAQKNILVASAMTFRDNKFVVKTVSGVEFTFDGFAGITRLDYSTASLKYLSELKPTNIVSNDNSEVPLFSVNYDKNLDDGKLKIAGTSYDKGLSIHSGVALTWTLNGDFRRIKGLLGVDDEFDIPSAVRVIIEADGREIFKQVVRKKDKPVEVNLDITAAKLLRVIVQSDDPTGSDLGNQVNFVEARVTK